MPRSQKQPILYQDKLSISEKHLRFATPEDVAVYRAERLKCNKLVEIGAGIGGQTIAFSKTCKNVLAIELDKAKVKILSDNLKKLKIRNVEVAIGDALSQNIINKISQFQPDIIFVDTERPEQAERTLENVRPPLKKILDIFPEITQQIAIEIPPLTKNLSELGEDFEKEFISLNHQLNRLTLYFGKLKEHEVSAIVLPSKEKITYFSEKIYATKSAHGFRYIYVINPTITASGLLPELSRKFDSPVIQSDKPLMLSNSKINSGFLTGFEILKTCKNNQKEILECLKKLDAKSVVIRYSIEPKDYWKTRNFYENSLKGTRTINLFANEKSDEAILTEATV